MQATHARLLVVQVRTTHACSTHGQRLLMGVPPGRVAQACAASHTAARQGVLSTFILAQQARCAACQAYVAHMGKRHSKSNQRSTSTTTVPWRQPAYEYMNQVSGSTLDAHDRSKRVTSRPQGYLQQPAEQATPQSHERTHVAMGRFGFEDQDKSPASHACTQCNAITPPHDFRPAQLAILQPRP